MCPSEPHERTSRSSIEGGIFHERVRCLAAAPPNSRPSCLTRARASRSALSFCSLSTIFLPHVCQRLASAKESVNRGSSLQRAGGADLAGKSHTIAFTVLSALAMDFTQPVARPLPELVLHPRSAAQSALVREEISVDRAVAHPHLRRCARVSRPPGCAPSSVERACRSVAGR